MTIRKITIGSCKDIHQHDDVAFPKAWVSEKQLSVQEDPSDQYDVLRLKDLMDRIYPIGAIYLNVTGTNPNTTMKFGTWVQIASGCMLVGYLAGDPDFGVVEGVGGSKTKNLQHKHDYTDIPQHNHTVTDPTHHHSYGLLDTGGAAKNVAAGADIEIASTGANTGDSATGVTVDNAGVAAPQTANKLSTTEDVLNPFFVVYIWKRTA